MPGDLTKKKESLMRISLPTLVAAALLLGLTPSDRAQAPSPPDRIEEDWELVVARPDLVQVGPQITTCMSPVRDASSPFVAFDMNYREYPSYSDGGMQLQVWSGKTLLSNASEGSAQFNTPNEKITWTQSMILAGGNLQYSIKNGRSTTWPQFGDGPLSVSFPTSLAALDGYSPDTSVAKSGVTWQTQNVTSMKLVQVRYYAGATLISTDTTVRSVNLN
jgi:hypothetical protein